MAYHTRKTFNENFGAHPLGGGGGPSGPLQFMRNRQLSKGWWIAAAVATPLTGGLALPAAVGWSALWGTLSAPFEVGRAAVKTVRFLEKLGQGKPEYATPMVDTRQAYTMRQAALQTMHDSAYSIRGAIGNEARMLHS